MIKYIAVVALTIALPLCYRMASAEAPPPSARDIRIEALKAKIAEAESTAEKIEMERELAFLWLGEGSNEAVNVERFLREADRILGHSGPFGTVTIF